MAEVRLADLGKSFGAVTVLDGVTLNVQDGLLVSLLGPSGCGKTTTLRLIAGFMTPTHGTITVGGKVLSSPGYALPPERRDMSMIFQSYALWPHMTVAENVAYGLRIRKVSGAETERRVSTILGMTQLTALAGRYPHHLSGGQQQRVALARALVVEPTTLLLDEPLSNLDANLREEMREEIRRLHLRFKFTTVYVTHDQAEAMSTADLVVVMNKGKIEQAGTPEEVYERPATEFVARFLGATNIVTGQTAGDAFHANGLTLRWGQGEAGGRRDASLSIRPHKVRLQVDRFGAPGPNQANGTVKRNVYLGAHRDYEIQLSTGQTIKASVPSDLNLPPEREIGVVFPPEDCRLLPVG